MILNMIKMKYVAYIIHPQYAFFLLLKGLYTSSSIDVCISNPLIPVCPWTLLCPVAWGIYIWQHPSFKCHYRFPPAILLFPLCHKTNICHLRASLFSMGPELEDIIFLLFEEHCIYFSLLTCNTNSWRTFFF